MATGTIKSIYSGYTEGTIQLTKNASSITDRTVLNCGKFVVISFNVTFSESASAWTQFAEVPVGFRPANEVIFIGENTNNSGSSQTTFVAVNQEGRINASVAISNGRAVKFSGVYLT